MNHQTLSSNKNQESNGITGFFFAKSATSTDGSPLAMKIHKSRSSLDTKNKASLIHTTKTHTTKKGNGWNLKIPTYPTPLLGKGEIFYKSPFFLGSMFDFGGVAHLFHGTHVNLKKWSYKLLHQPIIMLPGVAKSSETYQHRAAVQLWHANHSL